MGGKPPVWAPPGGAGTPGRSQGGGEPGGEPPAATSYGTHLDEIVLSDHYGHPNRQSQSSAILGSARSSRAGDTEDEASDGEEGDGEEILGNLFDLTPFRLALIWNVIQGQDPGVPVHADSAVPYETFRSGLMRIGLHEIDEPQFQELVGEVDADSSGDITFKEWELAVQRLKLEFLHRPDVVEKYKAGGAGMAALRCVDWSAVHSERMDVDGEDMCWAWLQASRPVWARMRWVSVEGRDELMLQRLAVKYRLHPLSVEDALEVSAAKVDKFESYIYVCIPVLNVVTRGDAGEDLGGGGLAGAAGAAYYSSERMPSRSLRSGVGAAAKGGGGHRGGDRIETQSSQISMFVTYPSYDTFISVTGDRHTTAIVRAVRDRLTTHDMLRQYDASYILYKVLDAVVDSLVVGGKMFRRSTYECREDLCREGPMFRIRRADDLLREMNRVMRSLRPLLRVVKHCISDDDISSNCKLYMGDVEDHLQQLTDELSELISEVGDVYGEYKYRREEQTSKLMYLFTVVATVFMPAQFITGVFGMNFDYMPELRWKWSYPALAAALALYFLFAAAVLYRLTPAFVRKQG